MGTAVLALPGAAAPGTNPARQRAGDGEVRGEESGAVREGDMRGVLCGRARRRLAVVLALLISVTALAACGKTVGETIDDATITTRVKTALLNDTQISALQIDVDTFKGIVTLSGQVASAEARQRAVAIARQTNGVVEVKSALQVNAGP
jgi:hypothetical protein